MKYLRTIHGVKNVDHARNDILVGHGSKCKLTERAGDSVLELVLTYGEVKQKKVLGRSPCQ